LREYVLVLLVAAAVTYLLTVVAREIALRTGAVARVRDRDVHEEPIPYLGGLAMLGGLVAAYLVARELPFLSSNSGPYVFRDAGVVLIAGALICAVGVLDDLFELDALTKLGGQVLAAAFLIGFQIQYIYVSWDGEQFALDRAQGALLTGFVVVATVNAVNFVDGLDGLAAGIVLIAAGAFFVFSYLLWVEEGVPRAGTSTLTTAALVGICAGFLPHNFHPARVFMGDTGSMLLGLLLAASAVSLTGQVDPGRVGASRLGPAILPLVLPVVVVLVPLLDLSLAVVRRTRAGRNPWSPDKQHLHHRLLEIGHSHRRAVTIMYAWSALVAFGVVVLSLVGGPWPKVSVAVVLALALAATLGLDRRRWVRRGG
jgi:UDP-GlcNAc:undecaprenyl-phosphate/decaprenyl-phosphate GlcNAc-1-phosphate transferase